MDLVSTIFTVLTIIVGGVCILLLVSTKTLRDSRDDQEKRIKFLEEERTRDRETIAKQATELGIWRSAVTGEKQLTAISELLNTHHEEARVNWVQVNAALGHVGTTLDHVDEAMARVADALEGTSG